MTLEEVFFASQTVAAVAVVASIVYLAREVRQSERVQRATMQQGRADRVSKASLTSAHPELAAIWMKGTSAEPDFTREQLGQWLLICRSAFLSGEDSFLQHKAGLLDETAFESYVAGARFYMSSPGVRAAWRLSAAQFGPDFRAFVDDLIAKSRFPAPIDTFAVWQEKLKVEIQRQHS
jgi:hypothetical protein